MKEIMEIIAAFDKAVASGLRAALATVVQVDGSSYRRPGARMLVTEDGQLTGAISGGCLEGDALRKALFVMDQQRSMLVTYDTTDEDDASLGIQLGCQGIIHILIEPVLAADDQNPVQLLKAIAIKRQHAIIVTLFSPAARSVDQPGTCFVLPDDGNSIVTKNMVPWQEQIRADILLARSTESSAFKIFTAGTRSVTAFIEFVAPAISLVVIGAGNDTIPLVEMATILGWTTTVVDGRAAYARPQRFAASCTVILAKPEKVLQQISIDPQTVFVLMTHNYQYDVAMLRALLPRKVAYIGLLGPGKKLARMLAELRDEGIEPGPDQLAALYGPSGLDIAAETPQEIALSILAEIKAVLAGRNGQSLRNLAVPIHPRAAVITENIVYTGKQH